jgi:peptidoglycan-associated lipoprotein
MRRVLLIALCVSGAVFVAGCPAKPKKGECKSSADCADQAGFGKVCVEGRCQECAADTDCKAGFACRDNRCVPKPQCTSDAECPAGQTCQGERCVPRPEAKREDADAAGAGAVPRECADAGGFTIRFGFDQATLSADAQGALQRLSDCLKKAPAKKVTAQGHADERGTTQYNVALGSRRAEAARKYLSDLGAAGSLDTVSFGEEKPVCSEATEDCWGRNRRVEFQIDR